MDHIDHYEFIQKEEEVIEDFKKEKQSDVIDDASELLLHFNNKFSELMKKQKKTNVLITGVTGVGKSSLINAIFGKKLALTGVGVPITQHFRRYSSDSFAINIYDSKGLEHGNSKNFIKSTKKFLERHCGGGARSDKTIHVVWYVINSASGRWEGFEEELCRTLFQQLPIMFIFNKADISTKKQRAVLKKCIDSMKLDNYLGTYDIISIENTIKNIHRCPKCKNDDIIIKRKYNKMHCLECGYVECVKMKTGRTQLVHDTYKILPSIVKDTFTAAQIVSFSLKEQHSLKTIHQFWDKWSHLHTSDKFLKAIADMMATLSVAWDLKHSYQYGNFIACDLTSVFTMKDKILLLFHTDMNKQKIHFTALGILWNRCLRNLIKILFDKWTKNVDCSEEELEGKRKLGDICINCVETVFSEFNGSNLVKIEDDLHDKLIDKFLKDEFN